MKTRAAVLTSTKHVDILDLEIPKLSPEQAIYYFLLGYTSKIAGTELGITEPKAVFSSCF